MDRLQNGEWLGMLAKGSTGGEALLDGSPMESGMHLRWQMAPELGFPKGGFDLYRRTENYMRYLRCGHFREADVVGVAWQPDSAQDAGAGFDITFSGEVDFRPGCGAAGGMAAYFVDEQKVRFVFSEPARYVRVILDASTTPNPLAQAYWQSDSGAVLVAQERAALKSGLRVISLFADRIDALLLTGENMLICEACFVLVRDGYDLGWGATPLNANPIYLPVTHPDWVSPLPWTDDQAEAESRLPAGLPTDRLTAYSTGFRDELHGLLYDLVGTQPQRLFRLQESDLNSAAGMDWPGMNLLQLMAVDPDIARILGQYYLDTPPSNTRFYDYRLIAHYGAGPIPGKIINFNGLETGVRLGTVFKHLGVSFASPNPMDVIDASWDGSEQTALLFTREITTAPISILLPRSAQSVTLRLVAAAPVMIKYYLDVKEQHRVTQPAGEVEVTYEDLDGMDRILLLTIGEISLIEIVLRQDTGTLGDLIYDVYHVRVAGVDRSRIPTLEPPALISSATGLDETGILLENQSSVGLRWERYEAGGAFLRSAAPVQYQVQRQDLAEDGVTVLQTRILNVTAPTLIAERGAQSAPMYTDRAVPDGLYAYSVRGVDIFGVLSEWSATQAIEVQDHRPPPPPQSVQAQYLDPFDPYLSANDLAWVESSGPGLKISWTWPGLLRMQAPDVIPPGGEFRVYTWPGKPNRLEGSVTQVSTQSGITTLFTDARWAGAVDALAGESVRVNQNFFQVTGITRGANCQISVQPLTGPDLSPTPGPFSLTFTRGRPYWRDASVARNWQQRLHAEPAQAIPLISGAVVDVSDFVDEDQPGRVITQEGAARTVTLNQALEDAQNELIPGALLCNGIVYPAYGHTLGAALQVHILPITAPGDSLTLLEPAPGETCVYYPGRRYALRLPGYVLEILPGKPGAQAQVAVSAADGKPYIPDDPLWSKPGRGGLGDRPGSESPLSPAVTVQAVRRTQPAGLSSVPPLPETPIYAQPANYYGQARYTLTWDAVPGAAGYAVYRCSGAALFDQDRALRQSQSAPYDTGSAFKDDAGFANWLAGFNPDLSEAEMLALPENHLDAWRSWAAHFYPGCLDAKIQELAGLEGNRSAFRRLNASAVTMPSYADTFDGRGQGVYLYRVSTLDAGGNQNEWSPAFPPVHVFDVTPPDIPKVSGVTGGERQVSLSWRAGREPDLREYWVWRNADAQALADVRRVPPSAVVPAGSQPLVVFTDAGLAGMQSTFYRIAAVDTSGNVSAPTEVLEGRAVDTSVPAPPAWLPAQVGAEPEAILLSWSHADPLLASLVQRRETDADEWQTLNGWLVRGEYQYTDAARSTGVLYTYRLLVMDLAGRVNNEFILLQA